MCSRHKETCYSHILPLYRFFNSKIRSEVSENGHSRMLAMTTPSLFVWQGLSLLCFLSVHSIDGFLPVGWHTNPICKLHSSVKDVTKIVPSLEIPENEVDTVYDHFLSSTIILFQLPLVSFPFQFSFGTKKS